MSTATLATGNTTQTSALTVTKVDAGSISPAKAERRSTHPNLHRLAVRVFCCREGNTESVPARLARRRLDAGPNPANLLCPGLQYL